MEATRKEFHEPVLSEPEKTLSGHILVADDDENIQHLVAGALEFMGMSVATVGNVSKH